MVANHDDAYADCVRVVPRRKAGEPRRARNHNKNNALFLTKDLLVQFYDIPLPEAAELLGIGATALKSSCRKLGIGRWPFPAWRREMDEDRTSPTFVEQPPSPRSSASQNNSGSSSLPFQPDTRQAPQGRQEQTEIEDRGSRTVDAPIEPVLRGALEAQDPFANSEGLMIDLGSLRDTPWRTDLLTFLSTDRGEDTK
eukprot:1709409-Rhodomonas_salina.3